MRTRTQIQTANWRASKWRSPEARRRRTLAASAAATTPASIAKQVATRRAVHLERSKPRLLEKAALYREQQRVHRAAWAVIDEAANNALGRVKPRYQKSVRAAYELFRAVQFEEVPTGVGKWVRTKTEEAKLHKRTSRIRARLTEELQLLGRTDLLPFLEPQQRVTHQLPLTTTA